MIIIEYKIRPKIIQMQISDYIKEINIEYFPMGETLRNFRKLSNGKDWMFLILDTGGYSEKKLKYCMKLHIYPLIRAKKGLKSHPTKELKKGY